MILHDSSKHSIAYLDTTNRLYIETARVLAFQLVRCRLNLWVFFAERPNKKVSVRVKADNSTSSHKWTDHFQSLTVKVRFWLKTHKKNRKSERKVIVDRKKSKRKTNFSILFQFVWGLSKLILLTQNEEERWKHETWSNINSCVVFSFHYIHTLSLLYSTINFNVPGWELIFSHFQMKSFLFNRTEFLTSIKWVLVENRFVKIWKRKKKLKVESGVVECWEMWKNNNIMDGRVSSDWVELRSKSKILGATLWTLETKTPETKRRWNNGRNIIVSVLSWKWRIKVELSLVKIVGEFQVKSKVSFVFSNLSTAHNSVSSLLNCVYLTS